MIYTARLDKNKNQLFLIKAMKKIVKKNSDIHLLLVGQDELNGKYQKKVKQYHLDIVLNNNIYIEYDGSGHLLPVYLNKISKKQFLPSSSIKK